MDHDFSTQTEKFLAGIFYGSELMSAWLLNVNVMFGLMVVNSLLLSVCVAVQLVDLPA